MGGKESQYAADRYMYPAKAQMIELNTTYKHVAPKISGQPGGALCMSLR